MYNFRSAPFPSDFLPFANGISQTVTQPMAAQYKGNGASRDVATVQGDGGHDNRDGATAPLFLMITSVEFIS